MKEDKYGESSTQLIEVWQKKKTETWGENDTKEIIKDTWVLMKRPHWVYAVQMEKTKIVSSYVLMKFQKTGIHELLWH